MPIHSWKKAAAPAFLAAILTASVSWTTSRPPFDLVLVQIPAGFRADSDVVPPLLQPADWYVDGARIVRLSASGGDPEVLTPEFAAACDPDVSFDGHSIVFTGRRSPGDNWQIWKMDGDGSNKVQITTGGADNVAPVFAGSRFYLNDPAPTPQIIFASTRHGWHNESAGGSAYALYGTDLEGEVVRRLTFNLNSDFSPDVLRSGRIVFSSWQGRNGLSSEDDRVALLAVNLDGTDLMPYYGNHEAPSFKGMVGISDFDDRVYFIETDTPSRLGGGDIATVSQRRPLDSYRRVTSEENGSYMTPVGLPDGGLLASYRRDESNAVYSLVEIAPESGERRENVFEERYWHSIDAQVIAERPRAKGRSNWLIPGSTTGVFYSMNIYRTNLFDADDMPPGSVKYVRVIEGIPHRGGDDRSSLVADSGRPITGGRRLLGIAPVEKDGSFHIRVPAETPVTFQLLDESYIAQREQYAWTWVIGNENRGCIGCHEDRELSPPNRVVDAVLKPAVELTLPPERRRTVDFVNQIEPIVRARCTTEGCHVIGGSGPSLLAGEGSTGAATPRDVYDALLAPVPGREGERLVRAGSARESPLIWTLLGERVGSVSTPYSKAVMQMPPHEQLSLRDRLLFTEWIDLGAYWDTRIPAVLGTER